MWTIQYGDAAGIDSVPPRSRRLSPSLVFYPDARLRKVCKPVEKFDDALRRLAEAMLKLMIVKRGIGLAGPQVGFLRRMFVCNLTGEPSDSMVFVNPQLVDLVGAAEGDEGCLSIPHVHVPVRRATTCVIRAFDLEGKPFELAGEGLLARVWQHENDHLDGKLILDRTSPAAKLSVRHTLKELESKHRPARAAAR